MPTTTPAADCPICLEPIENVGTTTTICNHVFHAHCINQWLLAHTTCPMCRRALLLPKKPLGKNLMTHIVLCILTCFMANHVALVGMVVVCPTIKTAVFVSLTILMAAKRMLSIRMVLYITCSLCAGRFGVNLAPLYLAVLSSLIGFCMA